MRINGYTCFGISLASKVVFPGAWREETPRADATVVEVGELPQWSGRDEGGWRGLSDGETLDVVRSQTDEYRFLYGDRTLFHLTADHRTLISLPAGGQTRWWRLLLDSVLFTVSLLRGNEALHAGAVATGSGVVAIVGGSGAGKSTVLSQLLRDGHQLVSDDILFLDARGDDVWAQPGPPLMVLPRERARGVGTHIGDVGEEVLVAVPVVAGPAPLRRLVVLDRQPGAINGMHRIESSFATLMKHLLRFPRTPDREFARFSLASAIATRTEMWQLVADVKTPPQELAALAVQGLSA
jgi:hypothetical protein